MNIPPQKAEEMRSNLVADLRSQQPEFFAARRIFDIVPAIFNAPVPCTEWKVKVANLLNVDPCSIYVIGTACTVVSLNPHKNFKVFDEGRQSDIDIAVISGFHFEMAWRALRNIGAGKYKLDTAGQAAIQEHRDSHVYWGMFATDKILNALPFGKEWIAASLQISKEDPMRGREVKFRFYRDTFSFVGYHVNNLRQMRQRLLAERPSNK